MQFIRRNRYALLTVAVLMFSLVMVVRQYLARESLRSLKVEEFFLLHEAGATESCEHLYQMLVQQLPDVSNRALVQDLLRTSMIVDTKTPQLENLVWKYHVSVGNELKQRAEKRLEADHLNAVAE